MLSSLTIDFPSVVLGLLLLLPVFIMVASHRTEGFLWSNMLRDGESKESALRLGVPVSLAVSTYAVMYATIKWPPEHALWAHGLYLATWSGSLVIVKFMEVWKGK